MNLWAPFRVAISVVYLTIFILIFYTYTFTMHFIRTFCRYFGSGFTFVNAVKTAHKNTRNNFKG